MQRSGKLQYHSDQNSRSAAASGSDAPANIPIEPYNPSFVPPPPTSFWPLGQTNSLTHAARYGMRATEIPVSGALSSSTLPLGGGSQARDLSAETRKAVPTTAEDDRPRTKEVGTVSFGAWSPIHASRQWSISFRRTIASSSTKPTVALDWASGIDDGTIMDQFRSCVYT